MKKILFFLIIMSATPSFSQDDTFLHGEWKIVSLDDGNFYINAKTDSISVYSELESQYSSTESKKHLIKTAKEIYLGNRFVFEKGGVSKQIFPAFGTILGTFQIDSKQKKIFIKSENSLGKEVTEAYDYDFSNELLYLTIPMEENSMKLVLEKNDK